MSAPPDALTLRQCEIIRLHWHGYTDAVIAARLGVGVQTVKNQLRQARHRVGAADVTALAVWLWRREHPRLAG